MTALSFDGLLDLARAREEVVGMYVFGSRGRNFMVDARSDWDRIEPVARREGFGDVVDGWEPDVDWLRGDAGYREP